MGFPRICLNKNNIVVNIAFFGLPSLLLRMRGAWVANFLGSKRQQHRGSRYFFLGQPDRYRLGVAEGGFPLTGDVLPAALLPGITSRRQTGDPIVNRCTTKFLVKMVIRVTKVQLV